MIKKHGTHPAKQHGDASKEEHGRGGVLKIEYADVGFNALVIGIVVGSWKRGGS